MTTGVLESCPNPRTRPYWTQLDTWPIGPKYGGAAPWAEQVSVLNQRLRPTPIRYGHEVESV